MNPRASLCSGSFSIGCLQPLCAILGTRTRWWRRGRSRDRGRRFGDVPAAEAGTASCVPAAPGFWHTAAWTLEAATAAWAPRTLDHRRRSLDPATGQKRDTRDDTAPCRGGKRALRTLDHRRRGLDTATGQKREPRDDTAPCRWEKRATRDDYGVRVRDDHDQ